MPDTEANEIIQGIEITLAVLEATTRIINVSQADLPPDTILQVTCEELTRVLNVPQSTGVLFNEARTKMERVVEYPPPGSEEYEPRDLTLQNSLIYTLNPKEPILFSDIQNDPRLASVPYINGHHPHTVALLLLPLVVAGDVVIGGVTLETTEARAFSKWEIELAWNVVSLAAGSIAKARLIRSQLRLIGAIEQAAEEVIITDINGDMIYVNPTFEQVSGYTRKEVVGKNPRIFKSGMQGNHFYQQMWHTLLKGQVWRGRLINRKKNGELYTLDATMSPVRDEQGKIINFVSVRRDVTVELQREEQYRQAQRMEAIGRLAGGIAHDFNNLLTVIRGYTNLLADQLADNEQCRGDVQMIDKAGERATTLVRQLLAFSRKQIFQPQSVNLNEIIGQMEKMLRRTIGEDIELITVLEPTLGWVKVDPGQMEQIVLNLAINARDAMPEGGLLTIETANIELDETYAMQHLEIQPGTHVVVTVSDSGIGMDDEVKNHIFEPFFTTKEQGKGTGLGLATVYGIVRQSGGSIWVYSEVGKGTTFKIYIPRIQEKGSEYIPKPDVPEVHSLEGSETILIVEDEPMLRKFFGKAMREKGYVVLEAKDGREALQQIDQALTPIALMMVDVVMPGMSGPKLVEQVMSRYPQLKILYMSGYTESVVTHLNTLDQTVNFLQKPFNAHTLLTKVRELLDGH